MIKETINKVVTSEDYYKRGTRSRISEIHHPRILRPRHYVAMTVEGMVGIRRLIRFYTTILTLGTRINTNKALFWFSIFCASV